jgi:hypothetical protein
VERKANTCPEVESSVDGDCGEVVDGSSWVGGNLSIVTSSGWVGRRGDDEGKGSLSGSGRVSTE